MLDIFRGRGGHPLLRNGEENNEDMSDAIRAGCGDIVGF
jgi:hypothetical protein